MKTRGVFRLPISILLLAGLGVQVVRADSGTEPHLPGIQLVVDTPLDSNAAAYQSCLPTIPGDCSLRGAISRANAETGAIFTILLPQETYHLTLPGEEDDNISGDLDLRGNVVIYPRSVGVVVITADGLDRVIQIFEGAYAAINNVTITGGQAGEGQSGGGIYNLGSLMLANVVVSGNRAGDGRMAAMEDRQGEPGGSGGGIENQGELTCSNCMVFNNQAGKGGDTLPEHQGYPGQTGGLGGVGGGIANRGFLTLLNSTINSNQAGAGGVGNSTYVPPWPYPGPELAPGIAESPASYDYAGNGGDGGSGGGLFNSSRLSIADSQVFDNQAGSGGEGGAAWISGGIGGQGGNGGGISSYGWLKVERSTIANNRSGLSGASGYGGYKQGAAGSRGPGHGGGLYNSGEAHLNDSQVIVNSTAPEYHHLHYQTADGGGIYNDHNGNMSLRETQVNGNLASGAGGGIMNRAELDIAGGEVNENQARRMGGGISNEGQLVGRSFSLSDNTSGPGYDGFQGFAGIAGAQQPLDGETPVGGGLFNGGKAWLAEIQINKNTAGNGGKGGDHNYGSYHNYPGGDGGSGGYGGGVNNKGWLEITLSALQGNQTGQGGIGGASQNGNGLNGNGGPGGAIFNSGALDAAFLTIQGNSTGAGASPAEPGGSGGGLANFGLLNFRDSQISGNQTALGGVGGGVAFFGCSEKLQPEIANTSILDNHASSEGGGLYLKGCDASLDNLVIAGNQIDAGNLGSGLYLADQNTILRHLTIANNTGGDGSGIYLQVGTAVLTNTIIAGQAVGIFAEQEAQAQLRTTLWGTGEWANGLDWGGPGMVFTGTQNIHADPLFVDPVQGNYHIEALSPAVDAGQQTDLVSDLDNQPRPAPGSDLLDIGADETWSSVPLYTISVYISESITATVPAEVGVDPIPGEATPYISFYWSPPPQSGQWTSKAVYVFEQGGEHSFKVWVVQAGKVLSATVTVQVQAMIRRYYFPLALR